MAVRFYINSPLAPGPLALDGPEAHHLATVSRLRPEDAIYLFNGDGSEWVAKVIQVGKRTVEVQIESTAKPDRELTFSLEVAAPIPKGDRAQFLIEKLTELGVTAFVPLRCSRSVIHPGEGKLEKLQRYVIEASKQCGRNTLMRINSTQSWADYCPARPDETRWLGHVAGTGGQLRRPKKSLCIAVGPEGGFTAEELALATANEWEFVGLGPRVLRVETAALALAVAAQL